MTLVALPCSPAFRGAQFYASPLSRELQLAERGLPRGHRFYCDVIWPGVIECWKLFHMPLRNLAEMVFLGFHCFIWCAFHWVLVSIC